MRKIPLSGKYGNGKATRVDDEWYHILSMFNWRVDHMGYVYRKSERGGRSQKIVMHRIIAKTPDGIFTDHIDRDKLNNQKSNLRHVTKAENRWNSKSNRNNTSGYRGVTFSKARQKWLATMFINGKQRYLGLFETAKEAGIAYDIAVKQHRDQYSGTNAGF